MNTGPSSKVKTQTVHLSEAALNQILDRLDEAELSSNSKNRRSEERYRFRKTGLRIEFRRPEGTTSDFLVPTRNISRNGMSFLHGGFMHEGSRCRIQLVTTHNMWETVDATVVWCRYVEGRVHSVGVKFERPIDLAAYCPQAVSRRILVVDDDPSALRLASYHLSRINVEVTTAADGREGVDKAMKTMFDCVLMDIEMPKLDGLGAVKELREKGYGGKVVAFTAMSGAGDQERFLSAGFNNYIKKPLTRTSLERLIETLDEEPIFSSMAGDPEMNELINDFVTELAKKCRAIEECIVAERIADLERLSRALKGEAGGYGFEPITDAAAAIEDAVRAKADAARLKAAVAELSNLCTLVRPTGK